MLAVSFTVLRIFVQEAWVLRLTNVDQGDQEDQQKSKEMELHFGIVRVEVGWDTKNSKFRAAELEVSSPVESKKLRMIRE